MINIALDMTGQRASSISPPRKVSDSKSSLKQDSIDSVVPLYMTATKQQRLPSSRHQLSLFVSNLSQNLQLSQKILTQSVKIVKEHYHKQQVTQEEWIRNQALASQSPKMKSKLMSPTAAEKALEQGKRIELLEKDVGEFMAEEMVLPKE